VSANFTKIDVALAGSVLRVACEIANRDTQEWTAAEGWAAGYHLFDEPTGTLVVDGERHPLSLAPGQSAALHFEIPLPPEPGEYHIYVSPLRENVAWLYTQGWSFLLIDVAVDENGQASLKQWKIADRPAVARRRAARSFLRVFTVPVRSIWVNRGLIRTLVRRDVLSRYSGSFGGAAWTVLNPLLLMLTYFFVFGVVLKQRFRNDPSRSGFFLYYIAGVLPWLAFSEAIGRSPYTMVEHRSFIKKLVFPVEILPVNLVMSGLVTEFFGVILFALALLVLRGHVPPTTLYLPLILIPQILFTAGISWFLAALGVFVRDLAPVSGYVITIWFFITPICYDEVALNNLPAQARTLLMWNPIYILVRSYRGIFLENRPPDWNALMLLALFSILVFVLGHAWFYKLRKSFADLI
jgi:lipopolysaccharide transport system permease protein